MRNVENIPSEVMTLILLKLSVISLLRCKCVCKTWYALIKNPSFISSHLKSHNNEDTHLVVRNYNYDCDPAYPFLYALFLDKTLKDLSYQVLDSQFPIPGEPFGPYDGLFLVYQEEYNRIYLLNIATRETRALPQCRFVVPHNMTLGTRFYFGCGYDPLSDDYKLVFLRQFSDEYGYDDILDSHVSLYSFNNDSWRDLQVAELRRYFWLECSSQNSYLNGVCHWLALREMGSKYVILSFDISTEIFQEIDLPTHPLNGGCSMLEVVNDSLYLLTIRYNPEFEFSIWMMRDGCWTIRLTMTGDYENGPTGYWKNDTIFISHGLGAEHLLLLDLNSKEEIDLGIPLKDLSYQVLDFQFPMPGELFGPYDGLFLVYQEEYNRIYLLNIATREMRALPQCRFVVPHNMTLAMRFYFGCGYDPLSDDYKLVFLRLFFSKNGIDDDFLDSHVSLYSFNNDSWRDLQVVELRRYFWVECSSKNSYLNGVCHWLALRKMSSKYVILSFNMSSEIFQEIDLPTHPLNGGRSMLEVVNDSLYLLTKSYNPEFEFEFSIWMMRDGCWTIRLTMTGDYENGPMGYWKNDTIFMSHGLDAEHLLLLDLNSKEEIDLGIPWVAPDDVFRYNESLVSIKRENDFSEVFDIPWHVLGVI